MIIHNICNACNVSYSVEWHDLGFTEYDVENDDFEELEPLICPFCATEVNEYEEDDEI